MHIFQIRPPEARLQDLDPGFAVLDNTANPRPDWFEYWPIRTFLARETLDEQAFYGFLSPRFKEKTNLDASQVRKFTAGCDSGSEVVLFSPSIHNSAYFLSVFEHGESEHPGLADVARRFFARAGQEFDPTTFMSDSRNTVHSNYFLAKPRFWRAWLAVGERLFAIAEAEDDELGRDLRAPTTYRGRREVQMKIFLMERIATWLLVTDRSFAVRARDPFAARARIYKLPTAIACDALKIAYATQGRPQYKEVFLLVRNLRRFLGILVRIGALVGGGSVRPALRTLKAYWRGGAGGAEESEGS